MATSDSISAAPSKPVLKLFLSLLILSLVLLASFPMFAWYGYRTHGPLGIQSAVVAVLACWSGAVMALIVGSLFTGRQAVNGMLLGMLFRMVPPLVAGVLMAQQENSLMKAGAMQMMVVCYLLTLSVETVLNVRMIQSQTKKTSQAS